VLCLVGRVLALRQDTLLLADETGTIPLHCPPGLWEVGAGDLVQVVVAAGAGPRSVTALELLTPCRGSDPFPSPGGEYHRLHHPLPGSGAHRVDLLRRRAACLRAIRAFFDDRGYLEVQPPLRVRVPGLEPHLVAVSSGEAWLITSPEYHMKRLLAAGLERIYSLGPCWRGDEQGSHHLGEFTMLEWYHAHCSLDGLMQETEALLAHVALAVSDLAPAPSPVATALHYQGRTIDLGGPFERVTFAQACARYAGVDVRGVVQADELRRRAKAAGLGPFSDDDGFDAIASRIVVERVEPALRDGARPVFLCEFPAPLAALARLNPSNASVADRFELYAGGLELANAFGELTDPEEQRRRLELDRAARARAHAPTHAVDGRFIAALAEGIPPTAGIALGVDRLVMLLCDVPDIRQVVAFAPDEV